MSEEEIDEALERVGYGEKNRAAMKRLVASFAEKKRKLELGEIEMRDLLIVAFLVDTVLMSRKKKD